MKLSGRIKNKESNLIIVNFKDLVFVKMLFQTPSLLFWIQCNIIKIDIDEKWI